MNSVIAPTVHKAQIWKEEIYKSEVNEYVFIKLEKSIFQMDIHYTQHVVQSSQKEKSLYTCCVVYSTCIDYVLYLYIYVSVHNA